MPTLRRWDVYVDPLGRSALRPYETIEELETKTTSVFRQVDPRFAGYFETLRAEGCSTWKAVRTMRRAAIHCP